MQKVCNTSCRTRRHGHRRASEELYVGDWRMVMARSQAVKHVTYEEQHCESVGGSPDGIASTWDQEVAFEVCGSAWQPGKAAETVAWPSQAATRKTLMRLDRRMEDVRIAKLARYVLQRVVSTSCKVAPGSAGVTDQSIVGPTSAVSTDACFAPARQETSGFMTDGPQAGSSNVSPRPWQ